MIFSCVDITEHVFALVLRGIYRYTTGQFDDEGEMMCCHHMT